nr:hypothetical protein [Tanacetum cinerariifolium]
MALADDNVAVSKEGVKSGLWVKIFMRKVHTLLEMGDNDERKNFLDYLCIDLNYVEEQRNNLLSKHRGLVQELNTCKEQLLVLKQAKLDFLTMQRLNTKIFKENQNLRQELKELTTITKTWLNSVERPSLSKDEGFILPNHDTSRILPAESQVNTIDPPVAVTDSSATDCDSAKALKGVTINEPSSAPAKANNKASSSKTNLAPVGKLKNVKTEDDLPLSQHLECQGGSSSISKTPRPSKHFFPPCIHCGFIDHLSDDCVNYLICDIYGSYDHDTHGHNKVISLRRRIKPRNPHHVIKSYETCGNTVHTTTDHNNIKWFIRGKALQAKKSKALKSNKTESSNASRSKIPNKSRCSKHMTGAKSYLNKYVEHPGPKFNEKRETIFNSNKEIVMIALRVRDVYVLSMISPEQASWFFAKAFENHNWL